MPIVKNYDHSGDGVVMADIPVHTSASSGASLPSPEDARFDASKPSKDVSPDGRQRRFCNKWMIGVTFVLVVVAIILGIALGVTQNAVAQSSTPALPTTPSNDGGTPPTPPVPRKASLDAVINYLNEAGVSSVTDMTKNGTPQNAAAVWLADTDPLNLGIPEDGPSDGGYMYVVRYVLAVVYHSMNGTQWKNQFKFLTGRDVCTWNDIVEVTRNGVKDTEPGGVYCDSTTDDISSIHLSKCMAVCVWCAQASCILTRALHHGYKQTSTTSREACRTKLDGSRRFACCRSIATKWTARLRMQSVA